MHKIELICYAGSLACLKAALNSGADSENLSEEILYHKNFQEKI